MASNTQKMQRSGDQIIAPQYYNSGSDIYEVNQGSNGASYVSDQPNAPRLIATFGYTSFTPANTTFYSLHLQGLNRNAKRRVFHFVNSLNVQINNLYLQPWDSAVGNTYLSGDQNTAFTLSGQSGAIMVFTSNANPVLGVAVDSFRMQCAVGATAPTSGQLQVYVTEIL